ncbi:MAG: winged helix-turn-helix domain-containing protein, partial [Fulvivirga sp.]|nr:winged helix-turn-helix domain-containing protein [Fulvivirga sp.]
MEKELPKFHETFSPILNILRDGKTLHHRELIREVVNQYYSDLPQELLQRETKSGEPLLHNRIAWGKSYLKKGGFLEYPKRGMVRITEKGRNQQTDLSLKEVETSDGFFN